MFFSIKIPGQFINFLCLPNIGPNRQKWPLGGLEPTKIKTIKLNFYQEQPLL